MRRAWALFLVLALVPACTGDDDAAPPTTSRSDVASGRDTAAVPPALGPLTPDLAPKSLPVQAGEVLRGRPLPTNQWWTSALTGPFTENLWARPLVARATPQGLLVGATTSASASADAIITPFLPALSIGGALRGVEVTGYGAFSVQLSLGRSDGAPLVAQLAQGSPLLYVSVPAGRLEIGTIGGSTTSVERAGDGRLVVRVQSQVWDVVTTGRTTWSNDGSTWSSQSDEPLLLAVGPRPAGAGADWPAAVAAAAARPIRTTTSTLEVDWEAGVVRQLLRWDRPDGPPAPVALLPHQTALAPTRLRRLGRYATALGDMTVVFTDSVELAYPLRGFLPAIPSLALSPADKASALADLRLDMADTTIQGGSYGAAKALGRMASLAELAHVLGAVDEQAAAIETLRTALRDWVTYTGASDARWLAAEPRWGGIVAHPSEYGNSDYNDHHFHYGYLIRAAATLVELSPGDEGDIRATIDLLVADVMGGGPALPPFRVFNAYEGHSFASGFAPFADGNNQESSSEAVHAWEAIARWGLATARPEVASAGAARYAVESAAASAYWLGEHPGVRAPGYAHQVAGIVWGGKVDFATWFDARASAAIGIQLLPFTFGSLYRSDRTASAARVGAARRADGDKLLWPDLFLMEEAIADPAAAARGLDFGPPIEAGNSRTLLRYWVLALGQLGGRASDVRATDAGGMAFDTALVARNVGRRPLAVGFVDRDGDTVATLDVPPGGTVVKRR
ncbi:MAG: GH81 [uncultured Acidimicrobiales bacterium]|uniref:glucan endo-1,3-beta-D-glucosidase n=1 Tax=uncultured Acidimicrobiales bacterium TaxID=310071 RepID=A0A6J4H9A2_9ACTN|nr:MAG: GH81 [uncultured Acidimicrobiales bacterium]